MKHHMATRIQNAIDRGALPSGTSPVAVFRVLLTTIHGAATLRLCDRLAQGEDADALARATLDVAIEGLRGRHHRPSIRTQRQSVMFRELRVIFLLTAAGTAAVSGPACIGETANAAARQLCTGGDRNQRRNGCTAADRSIPACDRFTRCRRTGGRRARNWRAASCRRPSSAAPAWPQACRWRAFPRPRRTRRCAKRRQTRTKSRRGSG